MNKPYELEVIDTVNKRPSVRVRPRLDIDAYDDRGAMDYLGDMQNWTVEAECGWRTSYDTFKFRNQEQLLMFVMRWS